MLIDTHCHLTMSQYDPDRSGVIQRARDAGVTRMITIGTDLEDSQRAVALAEGHDFMSAAVGIHPHDVREIKDPEAAYQALKSLTSNSKVVALGETGLDYHYMHSPAPLQQEHFRIMIRMAKACGLPLIIHTREAKEDTLKILREEMGDRLRGVFHCFSGDMEMAETALAMGFYLSFSGVVTFQNAQNAKTILEIVKAVPLDRILIETDAPFLTPHPHRGKRNEPAYVRYVAEKVAEVKGLSIEETARAIFVNAATLFNLNLENTP
ncbi:MAG: TatD family hydrolase [Nitrospirae bacterium]|nr:TatD family hydrolase [Nitrospirota bacterium]